MTTQFIIEHIEWGVANAHMWGFVLVFVLMAIESSFIPFPSEVTMIPAGFLAYRGELTFGNPLIDAMAVVLCGLAGSLVGAFINYYLALFLGRPFLYRYGKYFFVKPNILSRAEEIFLEYGEITTFVCRLLPGIRQLISLPAGVSRMSLVRFTTFTALGAGIWSAILVGIGYYLGTLSADMTYAQLVNRGKDILKEHYIWIVLFLVLLIVIYALIHHLVMSPKRERRSE
ncbi:MAG: DedA family protein [Desulfobacteraceae bacterium]|jgi:membrane protein DedA with SNARE-associated domain